MKRGHPANLVDGIPKSLRSSIKNNATANFEALVLRRAQWFRRWTARAFELRAEEAKLHAALPPHRRNILKSKRFLVLQGILEYLKYPDLGIVQDMRDRFSLVGTAEGGGILPAEFQPATLTINDLSMHSGRSNIAVFHSTKSSGNEAVDAELWRKTQAEVEKGWLAELPGLP